MVYFSCFALSWAQCYSEHPLQVTFFYVWTLKNLSLPLALFLTLFFTLLQLCVSSQCYSTFAKLMLTVKMNFDAKTPSRYGLCLLSVKHSQVSYSPLFTSRAPNGTPLLRKEELFFCFFSCWFLTRPFVKQTSFFPSETSAEWKNPVRIICERLVYAPHHSLLLPWSHHGEKPFLFHCLVLVFGFFFYPS